MNLLKEGKTNWKYILIVVILAVIVGGAILGYCWWTKQEIPLLEIKKPEEVEEEIVDWRIYRNERYGFEFTFPDRWKDYKVSEEDTAIAFKLKHTRDDEYHTVFRIKIYPKEKWDQLQSKEEPSVEKYIDEKQGYILAYSVGHDDEGYVGFPEVVPGEIYQGPFYDVENKIIPTFKFLAEDETANWKTYRNEEYGYEMKYPREWKLSVTPPNEFSPQGDWGKQIGELAVLQNPAVEEPYCNLHLTIYSNPKNLSIRDFYGVRFSSIHKGKGSGSILFGKNQLLGMRYYMERIVKSFPEEDWVEAIITKKDGNIIELFWWWGKGCSKEVPQIISTFRIFGPLPREYVNIVEDEIPDFTLETLTPGDWKIYRNEEYGFELKYPKFFTVINAKNYYSPDIMTDFLGIKCDSVIDLQTRQYPCIVSIKASKENIEAVEKNIDSSLSAPGNYLVSKKEISISNHKGIEYHWGVWEGGVTAITTLLPYNSQTYIISGCELDGFEEIVNQMLSTFRFLE